MKTPMFYLGALLFQVTGKLKRAANLYTTTISPISYIPCCKQ